MEPEPIYTQIESSSIGFSDEETRQGLETYWSIEE